MSKSIKVGYVTLRARGPHWQAGFRDPATGRRLRVAVRAVSEADAKRQARALSDQIASGRFQARGRGADGPTVTEALKAAIDASGGNVETRQWLTGRANEFLKWLSAAAPTVRQWGQVTTETARAYLGHVQQLKKKDKTSLTDRTVHARLQPVKMASRYWSENDPARFRDIARAVRFRAQRGNPLEARAKELRKALSAADTAAFLAYLQKHAPHLRGPVMLQCLCGLRVREALALRECDVDLSGGTITVTATEGHTPKNQTSYRSIPVAAPVLAVLRETILALPVGDTARPIFAVPRSGRQWRERNYAHTLRKAFRRSGVAGLQGGYVPRMFRASFVTAVCSAGADLELVKVYVGHVRDMLGSHYDQVGADRLAEVTAALAKWWHKTGTVEKLAAVSQAKSKL